jgi:hypothetical protein
MQTFKRCFRVTLTSIVLCASSQVSADHSWNGYHWSRSQNPVQLSIGNNLTGSWPTYYTEALQYWTFESVTLNAVAGGTDSRRCKPKLGRIEACNDTYGRNGWLGVAQIWLDGKHITQGTAKLNDTYFKMEKYNTRPWRSMVYCQEVGHTLGLGHINETYNTPNVGSCMDYTNSPEGPPSNQYPDANDYAHLNEMYQHLEAVPNGTTTQMSPTAGRSEAHTPIEWGGLVRSLNGGRTQQFERNLGNNRKLVTFVIWADERGQH